MKKYLSFAMLLATLSVAMAAPDKDGLQAKENAAWQNYKDKKTDEFKKLVSPELVAVYATGASNLHRELETMAKWNIKSFTLSNYEVTMADPETAVCTYQVKVDGTMGGTDMSGLHNCATVWQMKNGDWRAIFHTDVKAMSPPTQ